MSGNILLTTATLFVIAMYRKLMIIEPSRRIRENRSEGEETILRGQSNRPSLTNIKWHWSEEEKSQWTNSDIDWKQIRQISSDSKQFHTHQPICFEHYFHYLATCSAKNTIWMIYRLSEGEKTANEPIPIQLWVGNKSGILIGIWHSQHVTPKNRLELAIAVVDCR
jgi:hypothetical protein